MFVFNSLFMFLSPVRLFMVYLSCFVSLLLFLIIGSLAISLASSSGFCISPMFVHGLFLSPVRSFVLLFAGHFSRLFVLRGVEAVSFRLPVKSTVVRRRPVLFLHASVPFQCGRTGEG